MTTYPIIPPVLMPVSLTRARQALRIDEDDFGLDDEITAFLVGVTQELENTIGQCVMPQTWRVKTDALGDIRLPHPAISIAAVTYLDDAGQTMTLPDDQYRIETARYESTLVGAAGVTWPSTYSAADAVTVDVVAGMAPDQESVPPAIVLYIIQRIKQQFDPAARVERDTVQSNYTESLLDQFKVKP